jgi:hypothetical protein
MDHEGPEWEERYNSTLSLTSALDVCVCVCVCVVNAIPRTLCHRKRGPVHIVQEAGWAPGPLWKGAENLAPTGLRSPAAQPVAPKLKEPCQKSRRQSGGMRQISYRNSQILGATVQNLVTWTTHRPEFVPRCEITDSEEDTTTEEIRVRWEIFTQGSAVGRFSPDNIDCLKMTGKFAVRVPPNCRNTIPIHCVISRLHYSMLTARLHAG